MAHYVNNADFLAALTKYRKELKDAKKAGKESPRVPEYLGKCILEISTHLAFKPNFINYSFRDEMISDAVENCLTYIGNFDPKKSKNPFAYFTQIAYYAFLRRIHKEKRVLATKQKYIENMDIHDLVVGDGDYANAIIANVRQLTGADNIPNIPIPEVPEKYRRKPKYLMTASDDDDAEFEEDVDD